MVCLDQSHTARELWRIDKTPPEVLRQIQKCRMSCVSSPSLKAIKWRKPTAQDGSQLQIQIQRVEVSRVEILSVRGVEVSRTMSKY